MSLAQILTQAMDTHGLTATALAAKAGIDRTVIGRLLSGQRDDPQASTITALATALGMTADELLGRERRSQPADGITMLRHDWLVPSANNPRQHFDDATLAELADNIVTNGLLQNLVARDSTLRPYELIAGERRWRAIGLAIADGRWPADRLIPVALRTADDTEALALAIVENLQREEVAPLDEAQAMSKLRSAAGWTTRQIADAIGRTPRHVELRLALLTRLVPEVQNLLAHSQITLADARALMVAPPDRQQDLAKDLAKPVRPYELKTSADIAAAVRRDLVPAARAIFDVAASGIETITDPETGEVMCPRKAFLAAQKEAVISKIADLNKTWAWAKQTHFFLDAVWDRTQNKKQGGAMVIYNEHDGTVRVEEGLIDRHAAEERKQAAKRAEQAEHEQRLGEAMDILEEQICQKLQATITPAIFAKLLICDLTDENGGALISIQAVKAVDREALLDGLGLQDDAGVHSATADIYQALGDEPVEALMARLLNATQAMPLIAVWRWGKRQANGDDIALAAALGVEIPAMLLPSNKE